MKIKFTAAIALALWLAVTGWLATMVIVKPAVLRLGNDADETTVMVELRGAIERNRQMQQHIAQGLRLAGEQHRRLCTRHQRTGHLQAQHGKPAGQAGGRT